MEMLRQLRQPSISSLWITVLAIMISPLCFGQRVSSFNCPSSTSIWPCTCKEFINGYFRPHGEGNTIDCARKHLSDSQMSRVLDTLLGPGVSPVVEILASFNQLTKVPKQISKLPALSIVDLNNNRISGIAGEDGKPFLDTLSRNGTAIIVYLSNNQITRIPSDVFYFPRASYVELFMTDNQISSISSGAFRFPSALDVKIYLSRNKLSDFPACLFNFHSALFNVNIDLTYNEIRVIPSAATFNFPLAKYVNIKLNSNKISLIPVNAFNFTSTNTIGLTISLSRNYITAIPCGTFLSLTLFAVSFDLSYNQIATIPSCAFIFPSSNGVTLNLENNLITTISSGAFNFPSATILVLLLSNNQISTIPPNTFFQGMVSSLTISNNKLKRFESAVFKTPLNIMSSYSFLIGGGPSLNISGNPIDCSTDPCHLAWLLQNTSSSNKLLRTVSADGICTNNGGSPFSTLSSFDFSKSCVCTFN